MQPVQDLTIEDRVSRTQYQFTLEDADADELAHVGAAAASSALRAAARSSRDVASDLQDQGLQAYVDIDRDTAGRLGITPAAIDNALYNAFGQRLISTIFTQSNQYRVVLEVKPEFQRGPGRARATSTSPRRGGAAGAARRDRAHRRAAPRRSSINHLGQFPAATISFNLAPGASLGDAVEAIDARRSASIGLPASVQTELPGRGARVPGLARQRRCC